MPQQTFLRDGQIAVTVGGQSTSLHFVADASFDSTNGAFELEYKDEDTSYNEKSLIETRIYTSSAKTTIAAVVTFKVIATVTTQGTPTSTETLTINPAAAGNTPAFPRTVDHSALRTWAQSVLDGSVPVATYNATLDVRCDGRNGYTVTQTVVTQNNATLELSYSVAQSGPALATGSIQLDLTASCSAGLTLGSITVTDAFT